MEFSKLTRADMTYIKNVCAQEGGAKRIAKECSLKNANTVYSWLGKIKKLDELYEQTSLQEDDVKEILRLYNWEGMAYTQIAKQLEMSKLLVKNVLLCYTGSCGGQKKDRENPPKPTRRFIENPNEPTATTVMCIHHYYNEDIYKHGMSHNEAVRDISVELGRRPEYIEEVLRG